MTLSDPKVLHRLSLAAQAHRDDTTDPDMHRLYDAFGQAAQALEFCILQKLTALGIIKAPRIKDVSTPFRKPALSEVLLHFAKIGMPESEAERFFYYYESNGWRVGRNSMKSWPAACQNWKRHWEGRGHNQTMTVTGNGNTSTSPSMRAVLDKSELERVERRITDIRQSKDSHLDLDFMQKAELRELKARREELKERLGFKA